MNYNSSTCFLQNYEELSDSIIDESEKFAVVLPAQIS